MRDQTVEEQVGGGAIVDESTMPEFPDNAAVLISGPPMTGKYELLLDVLVAQSDRSILISTKHDAEQVIEDYRAAAGTTTDGEIGVVDCVRHHEATRETDTVKYADSPENLTRIGVKFTELFEWFYDTMSVPHASVGLHSISPLLMHNDVQSVYKFLQVLTGHINNVEWFTGAVVDESVADEETIGMIKQHFDGQIETRENDAGRREYRTHGFESTRNWTPF